MAKFRKKPVLIDAVLWHGANVSEVISLAALGKADDRNVSIKFDLRKTGYPELVIETLEGNMKADLNDWIIRGVKGELYPCKPDIFAATYEPVEAGSSPEPNSVA